MCARADFQHGSACIAVVGSFVHVVFIVLLVCVVCLQIMVFALIVSIEGCHSSHTCWCRVLFASYIWFWSRRFGAVCHIRNSEGYGFWRVGILKGRDPEGQGFWRGGILKGSDSGAQDFWVIIRIPSNHGYLYFLWLGFTVIMNSKNEDSEG